jgi:capsular polysaccharide transport system permease protein
MATRFGRSPGGYLWALLEPVAGIALLSLIFGAIARSPSLGTSFPLFFATAYVAFHAFTTMAHYVGLSISVNRPLLSFPCVTPLDTIAARFLLQGLTSIFVASVILGGVLLFEQERVALDIAALLAAGALTLLLGFAVGLLNAATFAYSELYQRIWSIMTRPLLLVSAVFYILEDMPRVLQQILWWNPLVHITGLMRRGFYPYYEAAYVSPAYVAMAAALPLMLGVMLLRSLRADLLES